MLLRQCLLVLVCTPANSYIEFVFPSAYIEVGTTVVLTQGWGTTTLASTSVITSNGSLLLTASLSGDAFVASPVTFTIGGIAQPTLFSVMSGANITTYDSNSILIAEQTSGVTWPAVTTYGQLLVFLFSFLFLFCSFHDLLYIFVL